MKQSKLPVPTTAKNILHGHSAPVYSCKFNSYVIYAH